VLRSAVNGMHSTVINPKDNLLRVGRNSGNGKEDRS
jgi:hypothetical protein